MLRSEIDKCNLMKLNLWVDQSQSKIELRLKKVISSWRRDGLSFAHQDCLYSRVKRTVEVGLRSRLLLCILLVKLNSNWGMESCLKKRTFKTSDLSEIKATPLTTTYFMWGWLLSILRKTTSQTKVHKEETSILVVTAIETKNGWEL